MRNTVLARQTWWLRQNPSGAIQGEVAGMDPQPPHRGAAAVGHCALPSLCHSLHSLLAGLPTLQNSFHSLLAGFPRLQHSHNSLPAGFSLWTLQPSADLPSWRPSCLQPVETKQNLAQEPFLGNDALAPGVVLVKTLSLCVQQYANGSIAHQMLIH